MHQQTFVDVTFEQYRKPTRRERFLDEMNRVVPWADLVAVIEPVYPKAEESGRPPVGIERMLRLHCLQQGSTCRTQPWKRRCTTRVPCGSSGGLLWAASQRPMRRRSASFGIYSKLTSWASSSLPGSGSI